MRTGRGHTVERLSGNRRIVAAAASVGRESNSIHLMIEPDITEPRRLMQQHRDRTGERLSLTAYVATCLARVLERHPGFNAFRAGRRLITLDDLILNVLVEREFDGKSVPEPSVIHAASRKTYREIHDELRAAQQRTEQRLGSAAGVAWVRFVPSFLLRTFVRLAARNIGMQKRFGVVGVTAVGMFGAGPMWLLPLTSATVTVAVGAIASRPACVRGALEEREHLCLTVSFNHDLIDGAPAARFTRQFAEMLSSGDVLRDVAQAVDAGAEQPMEGKEAR